MQKGLGRGLDLWPFSILEAWKSWVSWSFFHRSVNLSIFTLTSDSWVFFNNRTIKVITQDFALEYTSPLFPNVNHYDELAHQWYVSMASAGDHGDFCFIGNFHFHFLPLLPHLSWSCSFMEFCQSLIILPVSIPLKTKSAFPQQTLAIVP